MDSQNSNSAKFTFLYLLSLVSLGFFAFFAGIIVFQVINKNIVDVVESFSMRYDVTLLRYAIAAIIVSAPVYLITARQINKNLFTGTLDKNSAIRKWLTYFIILVTALIMGGWAIGTIFNFLNGELTLKFILKALTVLVISGMIFYYYLRDIKREKIKDTKDKVNQIFLYVTIALTVLIFIGGILFVESPMEARRKRFDNEIVNRLSGVESAIQQYYSEENKMPKDLVIIKDEIDYINEKDLVNPITKQEFVYNIIDKKNYEICTDWQSSNIDSTDNRYEYLNGKWQHEAGYQCVKKKAFDEKEGMLMPKRLQ